MPEGETLNEDLFYKGSSANLPRLHTCKNKVPFWDFKEFAATTGLGRSSFYTDTIFLGGTSIFIWLTDCGKWILLLLNEQRKIRHIWLLSDLVDKNDWSWIKTDLLILNQGCQPKKYENLSYYFLNMVSINRFSAKTYIFVVP